MRSRRGQARACESIQACSVAAKDGAGRRHDGADEGVEGRRAHVGGADHGPNKGVWGRGWVGPVTKGQKWGWGLGGGGGRLPRAQGVMKQVHQQGAERSSQGEPAQPETPASRSLEWEAAVAAPHPRPPRSCHRGTTLPVACGTACGQSADRGPLTRSPRAQQPSVSSLRGVRRTTVDVTPLGPTVVTRGPVKGLSVGVMMGVCLSARASGGFEGEAQGRGVTRVMHAEAATRRTWSGWQ
jgi:hypothetical protein